MIISTEGTKQIRRNTSNSTFTSASISVKHWVFLQLETSFTNKSLYMTCTSYFDFLTTQIIFNCNGCSQIQIPCCAKAKKQKNNNKQVCSDHHCFITWDKLNQSQSRNWKPNMYLLFLHPCCVTIPSIRITNEHKFRRHKDKEKGLARGRIGRWTRGHER